MAGCGLPADLDYEQHWADFRILPGARMERAGIRADCPLCGAHRGLSVQLKTPAGKRPYITWNLHPGDSKATCDRETARAKLAVIMPGCLTAEYRPRPAADPATAIAVLLDRSLPPNAVRVAGLQALGMSTPDIRAKLGLSRQSWSDVVRALGQNRRSR